MTTDDGELQLVRRSGKSEAAFRTISEVSEELDVPQHVLRFWESKFTQVKPLKRGGGRRYYRPDDVVLLRKIRDLLYAEGYTIKGVQKLLREGGTREAAPRADTPELPLTAPAAAEAPLDEDESEIDESTDIDGDGDADGPPPPRAPVPPELRGELESLLDELEQLRFLLQPR